jgi:hypothetical protein
MRLQLRKSSFLVGAHKTRIPRHVSGEDSGQLSFDTFRGQSGAPDRIGRSGSSALGRILAVNPRADIPFGAAFVLPLIVIFRDISIPREQNRHPCR